MLKIHTSRMLFLRSIKKLFMLFMWAVSVPSVGFSQSIAPDLNPILEGLEGYSRKARQEKLFLHTDKDFYLAGEVLWFKIYCVDGANHQPENISKVAYVELLDSHNKAVLQAKVSLKEGLGQGSCYLPAALGSGNYKLRGYTNWMKNFSPEFYFEKKISLVNAVVPVVSSISEELEEVEQLKIRFFPEGGNLLYGIEGKVAFHATNNYGQGVDIYGVLVNQEGDTVTDFRPLKFGIGTFSFTPEINQVYYALLRNASGEVIRQELPASRFSGYAIQLQDQGNGNVKLKVNSRANIQREIIYMLLHSQQEVKIARAAYLANGEVEFTFNKDDVGNGINHITVFNSSKSPVAERLFFKQPENKKLQFDGALNQDQYGFRQKVTLDLSSQDQSLNIVPAEISVAVYKVDSLQQPDLSDIYSYLWLNSDLQGKIESPEWYFAQEGPEAEMAMDNLMLVHGWRRFNWEKDILQANLPSFKFLPEYEGHLIAGKIMEAQSRLPLINVPVYLSVPGKRFHLFGARSKSDGGLIFNAKNFSGQGEIVVQAKSKENKPYTIEISNPFSDQYSEESLPVLKLSGKLKDQLLDKSVAVQVQNAYSGEALKKIKYEAPENSPYAENRFDETYLLDDYTRFPTMEEVIREYVKGLRVRKQNGELNMRAVNKHTEISFESDPLMLLNGVPVFDGQKIFSFDPYKLEKLQVIKGVSYNGVIVSEGIASFSTFKGSLEEVPLDPGAVVLDYEGLQGAREFYSPQYESDKHLASRLPDFRNVLLWLPSVQTAKDGTAQINFYTSDVPGKYVVVVQGISKGGLVGSKKFTFQAGGQL